LEMWGRASFVGSLTRPDVAANNASAHRSQGMRMMFTGDPGLKNQACASLNARRTSGSNSNGPRKCAPETRSARSFTTARRSGPTNSDSPGLLLLDSFLKPIYVSEEAVAILCYPESPRKNGHLGSFLVQRIDPFLFKQDDSSRSKASTELISGTRQYQVCVFTMRPRLGDGLRPTLAVMLLRNH